MVFGIVDILNPLMVCNHHQYGRVQFCSQEIKVDTHHFLWCCFVMAGLKSFLYGAAPILGTTGAALYERQRALVTLGVLKPARGRGPGSGVPLTPDGIAAVLISILATDNLAEVDDRVVGLINAIPFLLQDRGDWIKNGRPTFCADLGSILAGKLPAHLKHRAYSISVERIWTGVIGDGRDQRTEYNFKAKTTRTDRNPIPPIKIIAELKFSALQSLIAFTQGALTQSKAEDDE
jgi:hypothetical protein